MLNIVGTASYASGEQQIFTDPKEEHMEKASEALNTALYQKMFAGQEILRRALHKYGVDAQVGKCVEEMSELIKALLKERLAAGLERPAARNAIFEEIADVYIMLEQMRMAFEISGMEVDEWATLKIARLEKRLNGEG